MLDFTENELSGNAERDKLQEYMTSLLSARQSNSIPVCQNVDWQFHQFDILKDKYVSFIPFVLLVASEFKDEICFLLIRLLVYYISNCLH